MLAGVAPNLFSMDIPAEHMPAIQRYTRELTTQDRAGWLWRHSRIAALGIALGRGRVGFAANRRGFPLKPVDHDLRC